MPALNPPKIHSKETIALGAGIGLIFGAALGNPAVGMVVGAAAGLGFSRVRTSRQVS